MYMYLGVVRTGGEKKKLLNCEKISVSHLYVMSVVDLHSYLPVQGSCPHLLMLLIALSPQVHILARTLFYLLAMLFSASSIPA